MRNTDTPDEEGSILVLALVVLSVIGLVMGAALNYANSSLRGTNNVYKPERTKQYDAESAVQTAIQYIKANQAAGGTLGQDLGLPCPTTTLTYPGASGAVAVDVCPQANSLIHQGGFRAVLLTLGTDPSEGLILSHNGDVNVGGTVFSNSIISLTNPTNLKVKAGRVWAWGDCTRPGNISINNPTGTPVCNASSTFGGQPPKVAQDPGVLSPADWAPAESVPASLAQPAIPACASGAATLSPGVYYDPAALSALTTTCASISLAPGVYWLDFPSAATPWNISKTLTGPAPATCDGTNGAQLIFGNQSKLGLTGTLNIPCARSATPTGPRIALYGLKSGVAASGPFTTTLRPTAAADTSGGFFTATANNALPGASAAYPQDGTQATATLTKNATAELTLGNFAAASGPPLSGNAQPSSVVVKVAHDEASGVALTPTLTWGSCNTTLTPTTSAGATLWSSGNLASTFASCAVTPLSAMSLKWHADSPNNNTAPSWISDVDGAQVDVTWTNPGIPALNGCIVTVGGCSIIDPGANNGQIAVNDVVYVPQAKFAGKFNLNGSSKISTALIARAVDADINPNICPDCADIGGDTDAPMVGDVRFTAHIGSTTWTDARTSYDGATLTPTIKSWVIKP